MKILRIAIFTSIILFCSNLLSAENFPVEFSSQWYVCLGSYKNKENAIRRREELKKIGLAAFYNGFISNGQAYYRVLADKEFEKIEEARTFRDLLKKSPALKNLDFNDLWVCHKNVLFQEAKEVKLKENKAFEYSFSEKTPYAVVIKSYKEESQAENDMNRLLEIDVKSYIVKKYDDKKLFSFDLNSGAFKNQEEAQAHKKNIENYGIATKRIACYPEEKAAMERYDLVVSSENIIFDEGLYSIPTSFSAQLKNVLNHFPVNRDFQFEEAYIADFDNCRLHNYNKDLNLHLKEYYEDGKIHAVTYALYHDELFNKRTEITMMDCDDSFEINKTSIDKKQSLFDYEFKIRGGTVKCSIYKEKLADEEKLLLLGKCIEQKLYMIMTSPDFTEDEYIAFLESNKDDSDLLVYPQIRKNLYILPDETKDVKRDFLTFDFNKVQQSYAEERGEKEWAQPLVGHWRAGANFAQENAVIQVGFFDLDYEYNAENTHKIFMTEKETSEKTDFNHSQDINNKKGWYYENKGGKELSFSSKSYIIASGASSSEAISQEDLKAFSSDLKIWKEN
ncbi:MAG: SPOR domain-containing protein [Treponema sp.]|nr:SPOR domain-containing protein [Treponema sp.]